MGTPHEEYPAGAYDKTGYIPNGIERYRGYFYASNYFTKSYANGADANIKKLVRWKNWADFKEGKIEDVSYLIPQDQLPYYLKNVDNQYLLLTTFNHENPCHGERPLLSNKHIPAFIISEFA